MNLPHNGTSAPVRRTIWEPERTDNPFVPALPAPRPVFIPEWLDPNRIPAPEFSPKRETVSAPLRKGARS